jgi:hypothetical protein
MTGPVWDGRGQDPWLPARLEARLEVAGTERDIRRVVWAELSGWLVETARAVLGGGARPNPDAVWSRVPAWREAVDLIVSGEIRKALATAFRKVMGSGYRWDQRIRSVAYLAEVTNRLVRVPDEVFGLVAHELAVGVNLGEGIPELRARIDNVLSTTGSARWPNRATVIARTEAVGALNAGRAEAFRAAAEEEPDVVFERIWLATDDSRTRETHQAADGQRVPLNQPFIVGGFELAFPGDPSGPPQEVIQCVIGSTQIGWPGQGLLGSTRRRHSGTLIEFRTAEGHHLTVTPNHPVLTPTGYVPAGLLSPGQRVMGTLLPRPPEVYDAPPSAEETHRTLCQSRQPERVMGSRMDFHGDGAHTEVEVVSADRNLSNTAHSQFPSQSIHLGLVRPEDREVPLSGMSGAVVLWQPTPGTAGLTLSGSLVSRQGESPALSGGHARHPDAVGLAGISDWETQLREAPDDGRTAESDFPAHLQYALAAGMAPTEVVEVNRLTGNHWVYNLSTSDHWFTGNGIALHNCRCTSLLVERGESVDMSNRQYRSRR